MAKNILITGATGLVGSKLTELLLQKGYRVSHLGRTKRNGPIPSFEWNINTEQMNIQALKGIDAIIHLAGAGIADKRWTEERKREILESRTGSSALLFKSLASQTHQVKAVISASAIGYYGFGLGEEVFTEESTPGKDYLAQVTQKWEAEVDKISSLPIRVVKLRIGIVLSERGGALVEMARPIRWGVGSALGSGRQYLSWIHLDDLCQLFINAIENEEISGAYNAVSGNWVTNEKMTKAIAHALKRPLLLPNIPPFILKLILGEMAMIVLNGSKVSADKIKKTGFTYAHPNLEESLSSLLCKELKV